MPPIKLADVDKVLFDKVWAMMLELGEQQRHFNQMQTQYRTIASTWLLATIAALGFVYSKENVPLSPDILAASLSVVAAIGIVLLWILDILVYHELLVVNFTQAERLESDYEWLTQVQSQYRKTQGKSSVRVRATRFYAGSVMLLTFLGGAALVRSYLTSAQPRSPLFAVIIVISGIAGGIAMTWYARKRSRFQATMVSSVATRDQ